jgi:hypothetical protein
MPLSFHLGRWRGGMSLSTPILAIQAVGLSAEPAIGLLVVFHFGWLLSCPNTPFFTIE